MYTYACLAAASTFEVPIVLYGSTAINLYVSSWENEFTAADIDLFMVLESAAEFSTRLTRFRQAVDAQLAALCTAGRPPQLVIVGGSEWVSHGARASTLTAKLFMGDAVMPASPVTHIGDITLQLASSLRQLESVFPRKRALLMSSYFMHGANAAAPKQAPLVLCVASIHELLHRMSATVAGGCTLDGIECSPATNNWRIEKDAARLDRLMDLAACGKLLQEPRPLVLAERGVLRKYARRTMVMHVTVGKATGVWMPAPPIPLTPSPPPAPATPPVTSTIATSQLARVRTELDELRKQLDALRKLAAQHIEQGSTVAATCIAHVSSVSLLGHFLRRFSRSHAARLFPIMGPQLPRHL